MNNDSDKLLAEKAEGRRSTKGNTLNTAMRRTQSRESMSIGLDRVREVARRDRRARFTNLLHHLTVDLLKSSFYSLKRKAAAGVDGMTWRDDEVNLDERLKGLHRRVHTGAYRALPSRRVSIPKPDGRQRNLGVSSLEDKIVQHATARILNQIYEVDFLGFSYGYRPKRHAHQALDTLYVVLTREKVSWVLDADLQDFFDAINQGWLEQFLQHRIADRRLLRLINKWLKAGVMMDGRRSNTDDGTPQGAVISPLLANVFLHYVFDLWVHQWRGRHAFGKVSVVRFADDFIVGFQCRSDAENFSKDLASRLEKFGQRLHPQKTRLLEFGRFAARDRRNRGEGKPETFAFLGFLHICGTNRHGKFAVHRLTLKQRLREKLREVKMILRRRLHRPIAELGRWLRSVVRGYLNYHAVPGNYKALNIFVREIARAWFRVLRRRGQRHRLPWTRFAKIAGRWLPKAQILHLYPNKRFDATHPR